MTYTASTSPVEHPKGIREINKLREGSHLGVMIRLAAQPPGEAGAYEMALVGLVDK